MIDLVKAKKYLHDNYPNKQILEKKIENKVTELLCEIEPTEDHPEYSRTIAIIQKSIPHKHLKTVETYKILKGNLDLFIEGMKIHLKEGDVYTIPLNAVHWAEGNDTIIEVSSEPGWTFEDHIIV